MPSPLQTPLSSFRRQNKPSNIFFIWYAELCRRLHCQPANCIHPIRPKCITILDFVADRLKVEDWGPVTNALRNDISLHVIAIRSRVTKSEFLHDMDTITKIRQLKTRCGLVWTAYVLNSLLKSLSSTVRMNGVLKFLELDGLPLFTQYLEPLLKALRMNRSLKSLSFTRCKINDIGCQLVCAYVRFISNIEILNMSWCGLTSESGDHLAKLIKCQQISRYSESWHNSLRYCDSGTQPMRGIKRLTLNGNPFFGNDGLEPILDELVDDLWIKAIDFQKCGITDNMSPKILDVLEYNQSLEVADFRNNRELSPENLEKFFGILQRKQNRETEFQWGESATTLLTSSTIRTTSTRLEKAKSLPLKQPNSSSLSGIALRKTKTCHQVATKTVDITKFQEAEKRLQLLNNQLLEEIQKRKEVEKLNLELRQKLRELSTTDKNMNSLIAKMASNSKKTEIDKMFKAISAENGYKSTTEVSRDPSMIFRTIMGHETEFIEEDIEYDGEVSSSQISLYKFMEDLKSNKKRHQ